MRTSRYLLCVVAFFLTVVSNAYCQTALQLAPVTPCRLVDTRTGSPIQGGTSATFNLPMLAQNGGVNGACTPFDLSTAQAYSLNVTVLPATTLNYLTIWPTGQPMPVESLMNSYDGRTKANATIVPAGANGAVNVFVTDTANVLIDINAYFDPSGSNLQFFPLPPCRIVDTRNDQDGGTLQAGMERDYPIPGQGMMGNCGIPSSAAAYSFNITVLPTQGSLDYLTVWPEGETKPVVSTINDYVGDPAVANAAIVPAGTMGATAFYPNDHNTDLLIDTNGYFAPLNSGQPIPPLSLYTVSPCRVLDTRQANGGNGPFMGMLTVPMVNNPNGCPIPAASQAYVVNATVVPDPVLGFLTLWGQGTQPVVSTLNAYDGAVTSNLAIVPANTTNGTMLAYASDKTNLIVDAFNVMAPPVTLMLGNYAFAIRGYQTVNNVPTAFVMVGGLVADGHGNVTSGVLDLNNGTGSPTNGTTFAGTYSIDGTGVGTMQLNSTLGTFNFHIALSAQGNGQIIWDNTNGSSPYGSGVLLQQNPADFTYPQAGNYAIGTLGSDFEQNRFAAAGAFTVGANGFVTSGSEDINDNGELGPLTFTGAFAHGINTLGGRNLAVFNFAGEPTNNYAYYTIYQGYVLLVSIDATVAGDPLTLSTMLVQSTGGFNQGSLTGATVYSTSALAPNNGSPAADVLLGLASWSSSNGTGNFSLDENNGGTITQQETSSGSYAVASNGRVTLSGFSVNPILYLVNQDQAFVLGQDPTVAFGMLQPQSGSPFGNSSISGMYQGGTINPAQPVLTDSVAYFTADGNGNLTGLANTSGSGGTGTLPYSATYAVDGTGRAVVTGTPAGFMYVVSPTQVDLLPSGTNPILNVFSIGQMY